MKQTNFRLKIWVTLLTLLGAMISANAMAVTLWASVNTNKVAKNEMFQLKLVADEYASSSDIDFSNLKKDFYVSQPSFSTSINIINGNKKTRSEWDVSLAAKRTGPVTIPSFTLDGASSQPIQLQVAVNGQVPHASQLVEMQSNLDKLQLYPEQSAYLKTRLLIKTDPRALQNPQIIPPTAQGLAITPVGKQQQYQSIVNGVNVTVVNQDYRITAHQAGQYKLQGPAFKGKVLYTSNRTGNRTLLDADSKPTTYTLSIHAKPTGFKGDWLPTSQLNLKQQWLDGNGKPINTKAPLGIKVGDSLTRIITMDVDGLSAEQLPNIVTHYPSSIRVYADKPQFSTLKNNVTQMIAKQVLIPQSTGDVSLKGVGINWWNSHKQHAETASISGLSLKVSPAAVNSSALTAPPTPSETQTKIVTVTDAGVWPYITAAMSLLWLVTLISFITLLKRNKTNVPDREGIQPQTPTQNLTQAIRSGDTFRAQFLVEAWLENLGRRDEPLEQKIKQQLNLWQQAKYGQESSNADIKPLMQSIKQLQKKQKKRAKKTVELTSL
ncbi:BatD family protein [Vibrio profundum]|uniref:BatD family protein n=1 Tax=Vibrio profundum TaxID=2910247 RepID=UPI003D0F622D